MSQYHVEVCAWSSAYSKESRLLRRTSKPTDPAFYNCSAPCAPKTIFSCGGENLPVPVEHTKTALPLYR